MVISFIKENGFEYYDHGVSADKPLIGDFDMPNLKFAFYSKNNQIGTISGQISDNKLDSTFNFGGSVYHISYNKLDDVNLSSTIDAYKAVFTMDVDKQMEIYNNSYNFDINDSNGNNVASLKYHISDEHGIHRYYYFTLDIDGMTFYLYFNRKTVLKLKSSFYSLYLDDKLIAMSDNPSVGETEFSAGLSYNMDMKNNVYNIYMEDDKYSKYVCLFIYLLHVLDHEYSYNINDNRFRSEELDKKFDYSFIDRVRANEDPQNLPENMPILNEIIKKTKHSRKSTILKIISFFFIFLIVTSLAVLYVPEKIVIIVVTAVVLSFFLPILKILFNKIFFKKK